MNELEIQTKGSSESYKYKKPNRGIKKLNESMKECKQQKQQLGYVMFAPYHECPERNYIASPHLVDVHSVQTTMLQQRCKENQPAGQVPLDNCSQQLYFLS
jgi:hypothetical protein